MKTTIKIGHLVGLFKLPILNFLFIIIHFNSFGQDYQWKNVPIGGGGT